MLEINVNVNIEGIKELTEAIMALATKGGAVKTTPAVEEKEPKRGRQSKKPAPVEEPVAVEEPVVAEVVPPEEPITAEVAPAEKAIVVDAGESKSNAATLYALSEAGASLLEAGKMSELIALLHSFQVEAVTMLKPEQYDAFATGLRKLGARI